MNHEWNIGGVENWEQVTRKDLYEQERRNKPTGDAETEIIHKGAIALMYPIDYGY